LHVVVIAKNTPDTEATVTVKPDGSINYGDKLVVNPWDEYAITEAILLKGAHNVKATVMTVGAEEHQEVLKHGLAIGCDQAIRIWDKAMEKGYDSLVYANAIAAAIKKLGDVDLIIFGKEFSDISSDQHIFQTARKLGWNALGFVGKIEAIDFKSKTIRVRRMAEQGTQITTSQLPAVISVLKDINEPKYPTFIGIRKAAKAEMPVWALPNWGWMLARSLPKPGSSATRNSPSVRAPSRSSTARAPRKSPEAGREADGGEDHMSANIFVWIEQHSGTPLSVSWEALGQARRLSGGGTVTALVFGNGVDEIVKAALAYGADAAIKSADASLAAYRFEPYVALLAKLVREHQPDIVLAGATIAGRELLAGAAADLNAGLLSDVTELSLEGGKLQAVRPMLGGKVLINEAISGDGPQFAALRPRAFQALEPDASRSGAVSEAAPALAEGGIATQIERIETEAGQVSLTDANIIISGGRGVGGPDGFAPVRALAEVLGAAIGASRAAVDAGWIPYEHQVGQTGKVVSPDLYIAAEFPVRSNIRPVCEQRK